MTQRKLGAGRQNGVCSRESGFTLIEILVVVAILGIVAGIAVVAIGSQPTTSARSACAADYTAVQVAVDSYRDQTGVFPGGPLPAGDTAVPPSTAGNSPGITTLLGTIAVTGGSTTGPWLKDDPVQSGHYEIQVTNDGTGTIGVYQPGTYPTAQIGSKNTVADCTSVK